MYQQYFLLVVLSFILLSSKNRDELLISSGYVDCPLLPTQMKKKLLVSNTVFEGCLGNSVSHVNFCIDVVNTLNDIRAVTFSSEQTFSANNTNGSAFEMCQFDGSSETQETTI